MFDLETSYMSHHHHHHPPSVVMDTTHYLTLQYADPCTCCDTFSLIIGVIDHLNISPFYQYSYLLQNADACDNFFTSSVLPNYYIPISLTSVVG